MSIVESDMMKHQSAANATRETSSVAAPERPIQVMLVDRHHIARRGMIELLSGEPDIEIIGEACSAEETLVMPNIHRAEVVVTAMHLRGIDGAALCRELAERRLPARVVVISESADEQEVISAFLAGASGFASKQGETEDLVHAIRSVARDKTAESEPSFSTAAPSKPRALSPSLLRVLQLLCEGKSYRLIADRTGLSTNTVKKYLGRIYRRLGVVGRAEAVAEAMRRGLV